MINGSPTSTFLNSCAYSIISNSVVSLGHGQQQVPKAHDHSLSRTTHGRVATTVQARPNISRDSTSPVLSSCGKTPMSTRAASRTAAEKLVGYLASECDADCVSRTAPNDVQYYHRLLAIFAYGGRRESWAMISHIRALISRRPRLGRGCFPQTPNGRMPSAHAAKGGSRCQRRI